MRIFRGGCTTLNVFRTLKQPMREGPHPDSDERLSHELSYPDTERTQQMWDVNTQTYTLNNRNVGLLRCLTIGMSE